MFDTPRVPHVLLTCVPHVFGDKHHQLPMSNTAMMPEKKGRKPRRDCKYTPEERAVMSEFKVEYLSQSSSPARGHIFRSKILPAIFNYWTANGKLNTIKANMEGEVKVSMSVKCSMTHFN